MRFSGHLSATVLSGVVYGTALRRVTQRNGYRYPGVGYPFVLTAAHPELFTRGNQPSRVHWFAQRRRSDAYWLAFSR